MIAYQPHDPRGRPYVSPVFLAIFCSTSSGAGSQMATRQWLTGNLRTSPAPSWVSGGTKAVMYGAAHGQKLLRHAGYVGKGDGVGGARKIHARTPTGHVITLVERHIVTIETSRVDALTCRSSLLETLPADRSRPVIAIKAI